MKKFIMIAVVVLILYSLQIEAGLPTCPIEGQVRTECAPHPSCHRACNSTGNEICFLSCSINGCVCPNGTVIDWDQNRCVTPNECKGTH